MASGWLSLPARGSKLYALVWNTPVPEPKEIIFAETYQDTNALSISSGWKTPGVPAWG